MNGLVDEQREDDVGLLKNASKSNSRFGYANLRSTMHSVSTRGQAQPFDACTTAGESHDVSLNKPDIYPALVISYRVDVETWPCPIIGDTSRNLLIYE